MLERKRGKLQHYDNNVIKNYDNNFIKNYDNNFIKNYDNNFIKNYDNNFIKNYDNNVIKNYDNNFIKTSKRSIGLLRFFQVKKNIKTDLGFVLIKSTCPRLPRE